MANLLRPQRKIIKQGRFPILRQETLIMALQRMSIPVVLSSLVGIAYFDEVALRLRESLGADALYVLSFDAAQFIENYLTVVIFLFAILAGNAYSSLYKQQEQIYAAIYMEVSEAKSLLEQITLVCQGHPLYMASLECMRDYIKNDLRRLDVPPAVRLSSPPMEDPLESIMYYTSIGVPSIVYSTVRTLRQARAYRLGALQQKFPFLGIVLLYLLAFAGTLVFPLLSAATADIPRLLEIQSFLFGCLMGGLESILRIILELWLGPAGIFNVDTELQQMISGLEEDLEFRIGQANGR